MTILPILILETSLVNGNGRQNTTKALLYKTLSVGMHTWDFSEAG
jgi:hypothetical protein